MTQQTLPALERGPTFLERGPREKLYAYITDGHYPTRSPIAAKEYHGWTIAFTSNRELAMALRNIFPVPLKLIKSMRRRCKPHRYADGKVYHSWRSHPQGEAYQSDEDPLRMLALVKLMERI